MSTTFGDEFNDEVQVHLEAIKGIIQEHMNGSGFTDKDIERTYVDFDNAVNEVRELLDSDEARELRREKYYAQHIDRQLSALLGK